MYIRGFIKRMGKFLLAVTLAAGVLPIVGVPMSEAQMTVQAAEDTVETADPTEEEAATQKAAQAAAAQTRLQENKKLDKLLRKMTEQDRAYLTEVLSYMEHYEITAGQLDALDVRLAEICVEAASTQEKVQAVYQWIRDNTVDDNAALFDLSLRLLGIPSLYVEGQYAADDAESVAHAWNVVCVDGVWRYYDVALESYYALTAAQIAVTHSPTGINMCADNRFYVDGTLYGFTSKEELGEVLILDIPEDTGVKYVVAARVGDYPVKGFDIFSVSENKAWDKIQTLQFKVGYEKLEDYSCLGMKSLKKVVLPDGLTTIGKGAFADCVKLSKVVLPATLTTIEEDAFINCFALRKIELPLGLKKIGDYAFSSSGLMEMKLPAKLKSLGQYVFYGCRSLKTLDLTSSLTKIPTGMAKYCTALKKVTLPSKATYIGKEAFYGCSGLESIKITNKVTTIYTYAFANCYSLKTVTLGERVNRIAGNAFNGADQLTNLIGTGTKPPVINKNFYLSEGTLIRAPKGYGEAYKKAFQTSDYVKKYKIEIQEKTS